MKIAPCAINEEERLRTLDEYGILDSEQEAVFDNITQVASKICEVPIALVSLVDHRRQWFKSKVGLDAPETPRDIAFCTHAILEDEILEVEDASKDERFHDNPLVTEAPYIRFYAGVPLNAHNNTKLGTLCVISDKPHKLDDSQRELLQVLAKDVVSKLELKRQAKILSNASRVQKHLIQSLEQSNVELEALSYRLMNELSTPIDNVSKQLQALIEDESIGQANKAVLASSDTTLDTIQTVISSMLDHARLKTSYEHPEPINIRTLVADLSRQMNWSDSFEMDVQDIEVSLPRIPLSTVLSNIISNSIKHHHKSHGKVSLTATDQGDSYLIKISDDGPGLPKEVVSDLFSLSSAFNIASKSRIGLATVKRIVEHYDGSLRVENADTGGTIVTIEWVK
jgi:signal transduction histidine kinase